LGFFEEKMKIKIGLFILLNVILQNSHEGIAQQAIFLVRHADTVRQQATRMFLYRRLDSTVQPRLQRCSRIAVLT